MEQTFQLPPRLTHPLPLSDLKFYIFQPSWLKAEPLRTEKIPRSERDFVVPPQPAQHMVDLAVRLLYKSPHRTLDPDEAQFVIPLRTWIASPRRDLAVRHGAFVRAGAPCDAFS